MGFSTVSAYVIGGVSMLVLLGIAALIANSIKFQIGDNRTDITKRRIWFWLLAVLVPVVTFAITYCDVQGSSHTEPEWAVLQCHVLVGSDILYCIHFTRYCTQSYEQERQDWRLVQVLTPYCVFRHGRQVFCNSHWRHWNAMP